MWFYSRINFLSQDYDHWTQKKLADSLVITAKTISRTASSMMDALKRYYFDSRYARKDVAEKDPRNKFFMTKNGFIVDRETVKEQIIVHMLK